ncbi:MAG: AbrB/MazE/SpoVT family DNA-binding domain-containing protein [Thaumarchaeota archaeon]|nr:AbrB/MazE/SpoVT family DNA-binding domain-containing protein [Nitrososphaerota archaeon]
MGNKSIVGPKGQITIPKSLREKYHLLEGEEVVLVAREEGVLVRHPSSSLRGRLRGKLDTEGMEKDIEKVRDQWKA